MSGDTGSVGVEVSTADARYAAVTQFIGLIDVQGPLSVEGVVAWDSAEPAEAQYHPGSGYVGAAIDGDVNTFWHTQWDVDNPTHPHYIVLDLGSEQTVSSFVYVPRSYPTCELPNNATACNGQIVDFELYAGSTGTFGERTASELEGMSFAEPEDANYTPITAGAFDSGDTGAKTIVFDEPVTTRYLKLVSLSAVPDNANGATTYPDGQPWAHAAELQAVGPVTDEAPALEDVPLTPRLVVNPPWHAPETPSTSVAEASPAG